MHFFKFKFECFFMFRILVHSMGLIKRPKARVLPQKLNNL